MLGADIFPVLALFVLAAVILLIIFRRVGRLELAIWQIMGLGAMAVLLTGQVRVKDALLSIDMDVILFLFGMFVIGQALEESGLLARISERMFRKAGSVDRMVLYILFIMGLASAFLMNDTVAIIGTPVVLLISRTSRISPKLMLFALAFAVTIGSVMSPVGNPQNLLISIGGNMRNPFVEFSRYLLLPTILNLLMAYLVLRVFFKKEFKKTVIPLREESISDPKLANLSRISLGLMIVLILVKISMTFIRPDLDLRLTYIAVISMLPVIVFHGRRVALVRSIDWHTILFFVSMFVLMRSVQITDIFQDLVRENSEVVDGLPMIFGVSIIGSQLMSNVPLVALYIPVLIQAGASSKGMMALAAGSTIAGNLTLIGAASNVIIVQNAERRTGDTITFLEFLRVGVVLTFLNSMIYWLFLLLL